MKEESKNHAQEFLSGHITRIVAIFLFLVLCLYLAHTSVK